MPVHDGSGSNQDERLPPPRPEHSQGNPEQLVQGSQSTARSLSMQSQQLPTESQVFEDEVLARAKRAGDPPEEMPERHNHCKNTIGTMEFSFALSHSFCRCTTFWRDTTREQDSLCMSGFSRIAAPSLSKRSPLCDRPAQYVKLHSS